MVHQTLVTTVHAQMETLWNVLVDLANNPSKYSMRITQSKIVEQFSSGFIREVNDGEATYREMVTLAEDQRTVRFDLIDHPVFIGSITMQALPTSVQSPVAPINLHSLVELDRRSFHAERLVRMEDELLSELQEDLETVREAAEQREQVEATQPDVLHP